MRRRQLIKTSGIGFVGTTVGLAGCSGQPDDSGGQPTDTPAMETTEPQETTAPATTEAQEWTTSIATSHYPAIYGVTGLIVAQETGIFDDHGITVDDLVSFSGGGTVIRGMINGNIGFGLPSVTAPVQAYLQGATVHVIGANQVKTDMEFDVLPDSDISSIQDAAGKSIAISRPGSASEGVLLLALSRAEGISRDDVEIQYAGGLGESISALREGVVDISWNSGPYSRSLLADNEVKTAWVARELVPEYAQNGYVMSTQTIEEQPEFAREVALALIEANDFVKNNQEETIQLWSEASGTSVEILTRVFEEYPPEEFFNITPTEGSMTAVGEIMKLQGLVEGDVPWGDIINQEPLPEDYRTDWF